MDVYRLAGSREMDDIGYQEYFSGGGVVVIEWAEKIADILPEGTLMIGMEHGIGNTRTLRIACTSDISSIAGMLRKGGF
jgi:tRNA threonylcarbamoyladenosine biosynthesis protein TsaE